MTRTSTPRFRRLRPCPPRPTPPRSVTPRHATPSAFLLAYLPVPRVPSLRLRLLRLSLPDSHPLPVFLPPTCTRPVRLYINTTTDAAAAIDRRSSCLRARRPSSCACSPCAGHPDSALCSPCWRCSPTPRACARCGAQGIEMRDWGIWGWKRSRAGVGGVAMGSNVRVCVLSSVAAALVFSFPSPLLQYSPRYPPLRLAIAPHSLHNRTNQPSAFVACSIRCRSSACHSFLLSYSSFFLLLRLFTPSPISASLFLCIVLLFVLFVPSRLFAPLLPPHPFYIRAPHFPTICLPSACLCFFSFPRLSPFPPSLLPSFSHGTDAPPSVGLTHRDSRRAGWGRGVGRGRLPVHSVILESKDDGRHVVGGSAGDDAHANCHRARHKQRAASAVVNAEGEHCIVSARTSSSSHGSTPDPPEPPSQWAASPLPWSGPPWLVPTWSRPPTASRSRSEPARLSETSSARRDAQGSMTSTTESCSIAHSSRTSSPPLSGPSVVGTYCGPWLVPHRHRAQVHAPSPPPPARLGSTRRITPKEEGKGEGAQQQR
ncbi:hypothetical protein B0H10DRAFT_2051993 [Mycena sp. CBHHK59/15]|nr:hypothetical protein B0H10DRAFT_2051993 [Mycena sp. CBHHK59/15]